MPPLLSANAHIVIPPGAFDGRLPAKWADRAPKLVDRADVGGQGWLFEGRQGRLHRTCLMAGAREEPAWREDVTRFHKNTAHAELRPGCWDARQRLRDMDADGISVVAATMDPGGMGFAGETMSMTDEPELSFAVVRAWNDWYHEEWVSAAPGRFIPVGYVSYLDPDQAAAEVRRNAERGFKGVAFRDPADLNLLWVGTGHWDPLLRACEETSTVLVHHTEPAPWMKGAPPEIAGNAPYSYPMGQTLYQLEAAQFMNSMLFGGALTRFPALKVLIAESGGSWLPHYLRRAKWTREHSPLTRNGWPDPNREPDEIVRENFWFSTQELDVPFELTELGLTKWLFEDDYPHIESIWPNTAKQFNTDTAGRPADQVEALAWRTGSELFCFTVPERHQPS
jgi:predicted TIM-barrel fold metal-dependent hydrolase